MKIETKYSIGDNVYVIFKEDNGEIKLFKDKIDSIVIKENEIVYFLDKICEEFHEHELIKYKDESSLLNKIDALIENTEKKICPKCNKKIKGYPAISREDNKTEICSSCGQFEALEVFKNSVGGK